MGKKLDALLGRGFKANKFKAIVNLAISRLAVLRNQHQARCNVARSDVVQILNLGHHERALLRVEQVVKEQNMLDVYTMIEIYCYLLIQRVSLLDHEKECPEELKEAIASLIYACSRCGEFPELHEIRAIFTTRFGKEFVSRAVQLRNNCGVNPKIIQKLSTRMPSTESRLKVLKEIACENNIVLQIEEPDTAQSEVKKEADNKEDEAVVNKSYGLGDSDSVKMRMKYKDVGQAAQAAFESAAYAAVAARAAVELSRADSHDPDTPRTPSPRPPKLVDSTECLHSWGEDKMKRNDKEYLSERTISDSSMDSKNNTLENIKDSSDEEESMPQMNKVTLEKMKDSSDEEESMPRMNEVMFDDSDYESEDKGRVLLSGDHVTESGNRYSLESNEVTISSNEVVDDIILKRQEQKSNKGKVHNLMINRAPVSVRTRTTYGR